MSLVSLFRIITWQIIIIIRICIPVFWFWYSFEMRYVALDFTLIFICNYLCSFPFNDNILVCIKSCGQLVFLLLFYQYKISDCYIAIFDPSFDITVLFVVVLFLLVIIVGFSMSTSYYIKPAARADLCKLALEKQEFPPLA